MQTVPTDIGCPYYARGPPSFHHNAFLAAMAMLPRSKVNLEF